WIDHLAPLAGKSVLDVGCGGGVLAEAMAARGAQVTGIDLTVKLLKVAELHSLESGVAVNYQESTAEDWARDHAGQYDVVTCMEMLEHVPDPASVVRAVASLVKPGGRVFFSTINRNPKSFMFAVVGVEYVLKMLPKGTHEYAKFIRPAELARWAREAGLEIGDMAGLGYNPLNQVFSLTSNTDVNYLLACRKPY
ncbi:MAG: bifunctional 2-polyprenyl-6-hydroxyphenol methylase/3-demethylubiquinol 3-O-methyltransferase UbiG, partial [Burkholderiaceae bacterium]